MMEQQRLLTLVFSCVAALSAGTNYAVSAYMPQLAARIHLSSTNANFVMASGNAGVYLSGPFVGILVDRRGPRSMLSFAALVLFFGYLGLKLLYDGGREGLYDRVGIWGLAFCQLMTGIGGSAGLASGVKATSQSFAKARRGAAMATVLSCFGLSAFFYSSLSHANLISASDPTSGFLLLLALGCGISMVLGAFFVRPCPPSSTSEPTSSYLSVQTSDPDEASPDASEFSLHSNIVTRTPSPEDLYGPSRPRSVTRNRSSSPLLRKVEESLDGRHNAGDLDLSGWRMLRHSDFHLLFLYLGTCSGIGLMVINNLGTVTVTLAEEGTDPRAIATMQAHLVSLLSICNCLGRLAVGFTSDLFLHHVPDRYRFARVWWLAVTACLFIVSQLLAGRAETIEGVHGLALPTALTGFAYGCLFGAVPVVGLERFGVASYATNNGYLTLSPAIFANLTNALFGIIYDSHVEHSPSPSPPSTLSRSIFKRAEGGEVHGICREGRECFALAFKTTTFFGIVALGLALAIASRRSFKPTYHN
ncbi:uncharacterized protein JCM6883_004295 [Sporobolomyces salmoneus]|uniref:uncharacterized protein n=1 Tax=Sporobolomyces salmoneus TaxID=183962 RepID=UPI00316F2922